MSTPWKDAEVALWSWLQGDAGYSALGLHEFRDYLGQALPMDRQTLFSASDLPAVYVELRGKVQLTKIAENSLHDSVPLRIGVVHAVNPANPVRDTHEAAVALIRKRLFGRAQQLSGAFAEAITHGGEPVTPLRRPGDRVVQFWIWECDFTLAIPSIVS